MEETMSEYLKELDDEELESVTGGISDHSVNCGNMISIKCCFCVNQKHGQLMLGDELNDIIGCKLSFGPHGSIGGIVLAIKAAGPTPMEI